MRTRNHWSRSGRPSDWHDRSSATADPCDWSVGGERASTAPGVISADAADRESLLAATTGADVIYNCVNPAYHSWQEEWPPIANNLIEAAEHADAVLVTLSNLYGYGPVDHAMTEEMPCQVTPVRALCASGHVASGTRGPPGRSHPHHGGPRQRLHRQKPGGQTNFGDRVIPRAASRQGSDPDGPRGPAPFLDLHRRRRPAAEHCGAPTNAPGARRGTCLAARR